MLSQFKYRYEALKAYLIKSKKLTIVNGYCYEQLLIQIKGQVRANWYQYWGNLRAKLISKNNFGPSLIFIKRDRPRHLQNLKNPEQVQPSAATEAPLWWTRPRPQSSLEAHQSTTRTMRQTCCLFSLHIWTKSCIESVNRSREMKAMRMPPADKESALPPRPSSSSSVQFEDKDKGMRREQVVFTELFINISKSQCNIQGYFKLSFSRNVWLSCIFNYFYECQAPYLYLIHHSIPKCEV